MGEIIQIHVGQPGIQTGKEVWNLLCQEYQLEKNGDLKEKHKEQQNYKFRIHQLFSELPCGKYAPRSLFIDLEPGCIDTIKKGEFKGLFNPQNFINGKEDGIIYSRGMYTIGKEIIQDSLEQVRKEAEKCSSLQGFLLDHSICGGTGSGFWSLLQERLYVEYGKKLKTSFTLFPCKYSNEVIETYNSALSFYALREHTDITVCLDNNALYNILQQEDQLDIIQYKDINRLIAQMQSTFLLTCQQNGMNKLYQNLVPYPTLHFTYGTSYPQFIEQQNWKLDKIVKQCFLNDNQFLSVINTGTLLSSAVMGRGDIQQMDLTHIVDKTKKTLNIVDWINNNQKIYQSDQQSVLIQDDNITKIKKSLSILQNNSSFLNVLNMMTRRFDQIYQKHSFVHWYVGEGMSSREFREARDELVNLQKDYEEMLKFIQD